MMIDIDCFPIYIYIYAWAIYDYKWEYCLSIIQDCKLLNLKNSISVRENQFSFPLRTYNRWAYELGKAYDSKFPKILINQVWGNMDLALAYIPNLRYLD